MILICPTCEAKSRVADGDAKKPRARMRCGACTAVFAISDARRYGASIDARTAAALARARQGTVARPTVHAWYTTMFAPLGLMAVTVVALMAVWDAKRFAQAPQDISVHLQSGAQDPHGLKLSRLVGTPYAPQGGQPGILVVGEVQNMGTAPVPLPTVALSASGSQQLKPLRVSVGPMQTVRDAEALTDESAALAGTLAPGAKAPFVGLMALPSESVNQPWQVIARF
jgi:hypothetical protein